MTGTRAAWAMTAPDLASRGQKARSLRRRLMVRICLLVRPGAGPGLATRETAGPAPCTADAAWTWASLVRTARGAEALPGPNACSPAGSGHSAVMPLAARALTAAG